MNINRKLRFQLLVQNSFFVVLFLMLVVLLGYLASQYHVAKDITQANRNILTQGSVNVLKQMKEPINITVFATKDDAVTLERPEPLPMKNDADTFPVAVTCPETFTFPKVPVPMFATDPDTFPMKYCPSTFPDTFKLPFLSNAATLLPNICRSYVFLVL